MPTWPRQCSEWLAYANERPSQATDVAPLVRLAEEATRGGRLPATAHDYGFLHLARVTAEALVPVLGNHYSVPILHVGAPVSVRVHRDRVVLWRDTVLLAEHRRAPDGAHQRVVEPSHYALLFAKKPRAQLMLYREALLQLGQSARWYLSELSSRQRARLTRGGDGGLRPLSAVRRRAAAGGHGLRHRAQCLWRRVSAVAPGAAHLASSVPDFQWRHRSPRPVWLPGPTGRGETGSVRQRARTALPSQDEIDRALHLYEQYVCVDATDGSTPDGTPSVR